MQSSIVGEGGMPSEQYKRYEQLKNTATVDQLTALTDYKNPVVRCYAFQALASKNATNVFWVLLRHLRDTSSVFTQRGCILDREYVGDYFIDVLSYAYDNNNLYKLSPKEKQILDSIFLYDKSITLVSKSDILHKITPTAERYNRIREIVAVERNESALRALAKYRKQEDILLIASFLQSSTINNSALYAVREFPDGYFYPLLKKYYEGILEDQEYNIQSIRLIYQALAKYPRKETVELFEKTFTINDELPKELFCEFLLVAITKFPNQIFEPLKSKIKLKPSQLEEIKLEVENDL